MMKEGLLNFCREYDLPRNDRNSRVKFALKDHVQTVPALDVLPFELRGLRVIVIVVPSKSPIMKNHG